MLVVLRVASDVCLKIQMANLGAAKSSSVNKLLGAAFHWRNPRWTFKLPKWRLVNNALTVRGCALAVKEAGA